MDGGAAVEVLDRAGAKAGARDVVMRGADGGDVEGLPEPVRFERSLSLDDARTSDALLAYAMNGEPLPVQHGYPLRVIVPGWYSVTSVKWLTGIEVIGNAFEGFFQTDRYVYEWERDGATVREPVAVATGARSDHRTDRRRRRDSGRSRHPGGGVVGRRRRSIVST